MAQYDMTRENYSTGELSYQEVLNFSNDDYFAHIYNLAQEVVSSPDYKDPKTGYISNIAWKKLVDGGMLAAALGDRGPENLQEVKMQTLRILSYLDISLGLSYGITIALAIDTIQNFGSEEQQEKFLTQIRNGKRMALAITEENGSGSTALDLKDSKYTLNIDGTLSLKYQKHLQGLTGESLIVLAEKENATTKTVALILVDEIDNVATPTKMMGLSGIRYGINKNRENLVLNTKNSLMAEINKRNIREFESIFARSRFGFIGMTLGFQEMIEEEASQYATNWKINGKSQFGMEVPKRELVNIRARKNATESLFNYAINNESIMLEDPKKLVAIANILKVYSSECALKSARIRSVLVGGRSFYQGSALQDEINIWPFTIFEGPEPMLLTQIGQAFCKDQIEIQNYDYVSEDTLNTLNKVIFTNKNLVHQSILGQIVCRLFTLSCLDEETLNADELEEVISLLNLEIQQLGLEYLSVKI